MKYLLIPLLLLSTSCVTSGDLEALQGNLDAYEAGSITKAEFDTANTAVYTAMDERNAALAEQGGKIPTDPLSLITYVGGMAATMFGTNHYRNRKRKDRNEPV